MSPREGKRGPRRNRLYIFATMLELAKRGALKTQLMYLANLSFDQLNDYLDFLTSDPVNMLTVTTEDGRTIYRTNKKGNEFLTCYYKMRKMFGLEPQVFIQPYTRLIAGEQEIHIQVKI